MPTCNDNIQNQGEAGTDCGGPCVACATSPPPTGGSSGGGSAATTTTTTTTTTSTTSTTTTTTAKFNVSIPPNTTFVVVNDRNASSAEGKKPGIDKGLILLLSTILIALVLLAIILRNRKNFEKLFSSLLDNIKLD